ncbi:MAG: thioredoxin domain-containing protein, partial [archaeon]|nr:thioredoxin domain-containing protein [archaeon]
MKTIIFIITFITLLNYLQAEFPKVTIDNYENTVLNSGKPWVLHFASKKCESCQSFEPTWKTITEYAEGAEFGEVDMDDPKGVSLAEKLGVIDEAIPNIKYIANEQKIFSVMKGKEILKEKELLRRLEILKMKYERGFFK